MSRLRFLITGARAPVALDWVRRLGRAGHAVAAADFFEYPPCRYSRYLQRYYKLPSARANPTEFAHAVKAHAEDFGATLIIPTCEEIFHLAGSHVFDNGPIRLFAGPISCLGLLHDKGRFSEFTKSLAHSIQAPESHVVTSAQQLTQFETAIEDWVLKPVYSRFGSRTLLHGSKETWNTVQPTPLEPWLAQRRVCGIEYCTYAIAVNGRVTAFAAYHSKYRTRNLRQEPAAGVYFEPSDQPELLDFTRRVVAELSFTGQIAFDIIVGKGKTWVLECNPRATSGLHLLNVNDPTPYLEGLANDLWTTTPEPRMLAPAMFLLPEKWRAVRDMLRARDVVYASDDRLPLFYAWRFLLELRRQARVLGISLEDACTADIEWNGETPEAQPPQVPVSGK